MRHFWSMFCFVTMGLVSACGSSDAGLPSDPADDAGVQDAADRPDAGGGPITPDAGGDAGGDAGDAAKSCLDAGRAAGERFPKGDGCNSCECLADGTLECTTRACPTSPNTCTYNGVEREFAERFPSVDGCNECVCAATGLACTRRTCDGGLDPTPSAILVESLDEPCGDAPGFTARAVLAGLPHWKLTAPFVYDRDRPAAHYPETLPDTTATLRITYDAGYAVCRLSSPTQAAFDIEVLLEWMTADGAFDEGFHTYLRRQASAFTDVWSLFGTRRDGELNGTYTPACPEARGTLFMATLDADGSATGDVQKICETDLALSVGSWSLGP